MNSRTVICRFKDEESLQEFNNLNNLSLSSNTVEYNLITGEEKFKKRKSFCKGVNEDWKYYWTELPEFDEPKQEPYAKINIIVDTIDKKKLSTIFNQNITDRTKSIWFPALEKHTKQLIRVVGGINPKYPIYVVSKGRFDKPLTVKYLNKMEVKHYVIVEPQEYEIYKKYFEGFTYTKLIKLDIKFLKEYNTLDALGDSKSKGLGSARNFAMCHARDMGYKWCHILDDNIDGWHYLNHNIKHKMRTAVCFTVLEDFVERFDNVVLAGMNYSKFCKEPDRVPAFVKNTRIYSCLMCNTDLYDKFHWRGRYNEDTILSLDVLDSGYCTIQLNTFLADKMTTTKIKGGNTDDFYSIEGTEPKTDMLVNVFPQYAKKVFKFNRIHHYVDYSRFNQELHLNKSYKSGINNYGMKIVKIPKEWDNTDKDTRSFIENNIDKCIILS